MNIFWLPGVPLNMLTRPGLALTFRPAFMITSKVPSKNSFTVEFRRRGQFFPIAEAPSIASGVAIGKAAARKTLGASFRIRAPPRRIGRLVPLVPSQEFRTNKEFGVLVQRSRARLSSYPERKEIEASRKARGFTVYPKSQKIFGIPTIKKTTEHQISQD